MARVLVLTDRHPLDTDWKGAFAWNLIRGLAESQHQVLVLTTSDPETIAVAHPRLTIARPGRSWHMHQMPNFLRAILVFQPDIIHTFAVKPSRLWKGLSLWPYLSSACYALPRVRRFSTVFESLDLGESDPSLTWHNSSFRCVVFSADQKLALKPKLNCALEAGPLELELPADAGDGSLDENRVLIPAPVDEWPDIKRSLQALVDFLREHPDRKISIVGGWGALSAAGRREGWGALEAVMAQIEMLPPMPFEVFVDTLRQASSLWMEPLPRSSWRSLVAARTAQELGKVIHHAPEVAQPDGSPANFFSRLYTADA